MKPLIVTRNDFAHLIGTTPDRVSKHIAEGMPVASTGGGRGKPTTVDLRKAFGWLLERKGGAVQAAHARLAAAQAQEAEQRVAIRAGKYLAAEDVERVWTAEVAAVRAIILASYTTAADRVHRAATLEGLAGIERTLKDLAYEVLRELANPDRAPLGRIRK